MVRSIRDGAEISMAARFARRERMPRDDWKYDEEMWDGEEEEEKLSAEKQCLRCNHWVPRESPYCSWCGRVFEEKDRR
jgi:hypothetical protein